MRSQDTVSIIVPLRAEYVSIIRLTASGIASHIGFDFDTIEDIKVAISEVLSKIIEKQLTEDRVTIDLKTIENGISMAFKLPGQNISNLFNSEDDSFALSIISSLMDEVDFSQNDQSLVIITKKLGKAV